MFLPLTRDQLIGSWKLVSASSTLGNGEVNATPYGENPAGVLTYTPDGRVSALISYGGRRPLSIGGGKADEQAEAFRTFLGYAGTFSVDGEKVTHRIEVSSIQNYVGKDLVRTVAQQGTRMVLTTPPTPVNGKAQTIELTWERLTDGR